MLFAVNVVDKMKGVDILISITDCLFWLSITQTTDNKLLGWNLFNTFPSIYQSFTKGGY